MKLIQSLFSICASVVIVSPVFAIPVQYSVIVTVDSVSNSENILPLSQRRFTNGFFDGTPLLGECFSGKFSIDDAMLATDGIKDGMLYSMHLEIKGLVWGYKSESGFYGAQVGFRTDHGFSQISPTFIVQNHLVTGLLGGVFGGSDVPFIDFFGNSIYAKDYSPYAGVYAQMKISADPTPEQVPPPIPEPDSIALIAFGILALLGYRLRKKTL